ncbi:hypothetical protein K458DRAFT_438898 [Lentithecium fluviatile CBS 122367]|uniref:Zn(2)-C6 fungal-type domain-containing protein n=1 Tax=Lentithecium fluviatile CBS 122367 TaxID=1168545 RepID=A0A6G1JLE1_9PLEO|nr:hypothetical protein K458DRAFT_438898 [Lentithecium fluviatile CBS 122367]
MRTSNGCWTCRLRRKKCDEYRPICHACAALDITCHFDQDNKPDWMDSGVKQEEMAEKLKSEIKENARRRRGVRVYAPGQRKSASDASAEERSIPLRDVSMDLDTPVCDVLQATSDIHSNGTEPSPDQTASKPQRACSKIAFERSDTVLLAFYLENLLPFLFPFYRPSLLEGGRAWIFELMISSPVVRQATLCQSSYFFSLARGTTNHEAVWNEVLSQTTDALGVLRHALQVIEGSGVGEHLHGAVRIMASIMQMQRFEIAVLSFQNWQNHLNASLALFEQLLHSIDDSEDHMSLFEAIMSRLGPSSSSWSWFSRNGHIPSAEQAAFHFSSTLVIFDDIIASTALREQPKLLEYHQSLLGSSEDGNEPLVNLDAVVGLKSEILLHIGAISALEAWKQRCKAAGNLDVVELVHRATVIKESLLADLMWLETNPKTHSRGTASFLDVFPPSPDHISLVSRVWAHAALMYLSIVVSGWQPASGDVRYHVSQIVDLLKLQASPALLRTMVWPFCVAGCLAEPAQEACFRRMVRVLQPASIFGTLHKALEIMENVWRVRDKDTPHRDLAMCFRLQEEVVLLV